MRRARRRHVYFVNYRMLRDQAPDVAGRAEIALPTGRPIATIGDIEKIEASLAEANGGVRALVLNFQLLRLERS